LRTIAPATIVARALSLSVPLLISSPEKAPSGASPAISFDLIPTVPALSEQLALG
jgi:hypothetical protein